MRRSITLNELKPGSWIQPDELASRYNTSVTPVREALQTLKQEGLVVNKPHPGFYIVQNSLKQLRDILEMREILDVAGVE